MPGIARVLATLPTDHTPVKGFGWRRPTADSRVGLLVLFSPPNSPPWVGNFATHGDIGQLPIASHPDGQHVVVVPGGPAYVVDPVTREISATFGDHFIDVLAADYPPLLVFNQGGLWFEAHDINGLRWRT